MLILGIDPGPEQSGWCVVELQGKHISIYEAGKSKNEDLQRFIYETLKFDIIVCESIRSYGAPVGKETFETCYAIGEFRLIAKQKKITFSLIARQEYARWICGIGKISDASVRQALLLRFGSDKKGEPLQKLKGDSDKRSAFAIVVYFIEKIILLDAPIFKK